MGSMYVSVVNIAWMLLILHELSADSLDYAEDGYLSDLSTDWGMLGGRVHQPKCVAIPSTMTLCRNIGYQEMRLPNLLEHETTAEVVDQARVWVPLLNLHCHPDTQLFLCSLYSPVCLERPIYPCRSLCEGVKRGCEERINNYGFPWPEILRCDKFPQDSDLCIGQVNFETTENVCAACKQPLTWESMLDSYCWANFAVRVRIDNVIHDSNGDKKLILKSSKFYKKQELTPLDIKRFEPVITNGVSCDCQPITNTKTKLLLMGVKQGSRLVVTYITEWSKDTEFKKAVRDIRNKHDCKTQIDEIAGLTDENNGGITNGNQGTPPGGGGTPDTPKRKGKGRKERKKKKKNPLDNIAGIGCIPCKQPLVFGNLIEKFCNAQFVMKSAVAKLKLDSNGDKRLILKKNRRGKFYKKQNLSRRDLRKLQPVISGGANCDCIKANPRKGKIFIMGSKQGARFVLSYLSDWPKDSEFKRFVRAIRKGYNCAGVSSSRNQG